MLRPIFFLFLISKHLKLSRTVRKTFVPSVWEKGRYPGVYGKKGSLNSLGVEVLQPPKRGWLQRSWRLNKVPGKVVFQKYWEVLNLANGRKEITRSRRRRYSAGHASIPGENPGKLYSCINERPEPTFSYVEASLSTRNRATNLVSELTVAVSESNLDRQFTPSKSRLNLDFKYS